MPNVHGSKIRSRPQPHAKHKHNARRYTKDKLGEKVVDREYQSDARKRLNLMLTDYYGHEPTQYEIDAMLARIANKGIMPLV